MSTRHSQKISSVSGGHLIQQNFSLTNAGHFENCNAHSAGISHLSLTPDPYLSPNLRKIIILFSASAWHWVMHSEWGTHAIRVSGLHPGWVLILGMPHPPRAVPYVQLTFLNSTVSKREWLICKMKKTQREYDRKSYTRVNMIPA
jgi:hypothetical protein